MLADKLMEVLELSADRTELLEAAQALAVSSDESALTRLGDCLCRADFLARLDQLDDPHTKTRFVRQVILALCDHKGPGLEPLCFRLSRDETFLSDNDRLTFVLLVLATVKPMSEAAVALFRRTNQDGYFAFNAPLMTKNGSPNALGLFSEMMLDQSVPLERRIDCIHTAVLPHRTHHGLVQTIQAMLATEPEPELSVVLVETLFDFRSKEWFGPAIGAPKPPDWWTAHEETLRLLLDLSAASINYHLSGAVRKQIDNARHVISVVLTTREH